MKKLLFGLVALAATSSLAADKGTEFKFGGDVRTRYTNAMNSNMGGGGNNGTAVKANNNWFNQRNRFSVTALTGDKFQGYLLLQNAFTWGNSGATTGTASDHQYPQTTGAAVTSNSALQAVEAWTWWKMSDNFSTKVGRQSIVWGDGDVLGSGDWAQTAFNFDAISGRWTMDFLDLDLFGAKVVEQQGATAAANTNDDEQVLYGLNVGIKALPEVLRALDIYVLSMNADQAGATALGLTTPANVSAGIQASLLHFGLRTKLEFAILDLKLEGDFQSGKIKSATLAGPPVTTGQSVNYKGSSYQAELGANFAEFMKARVWGKYFTATGDDNTTASDNEAYQPLFADDHADFGLADLYGRSNLTVIGLGVTLQPSDSTTVGLGWYMHSKTTDKGTVTFAGSGAGAPTIAGTPTTANAKPLSSEIDVWATHEYGNGFSALAGLSFISPSDVIKNSANPSPASGMRLVAQGKYAF